MVKYARANELLPMVWIVNCACKFRCPETHCDANLLTTTNEKLDLMREMGVCIAVVENYFDIKNISENAFVADKLCGEFNCAAAFCGENFRYGHGAIGDANSLVQHMKSAGGTAVIVPCVKQNETVVCSTAIRNYISQGNMTAAAAMLGRAFSISGTVIHGAALGAKLGFPTANIVYPNDKITPPHGVYISQTKFANRNFFSITNIGCRPTVSGDDTTVFAETHIFNFTGDLYGKIIEVTLVDFLRPEHRFNSVEELRATVLEDIEIAKARVVQ
jgi:riboflavin kinase/FMN adenylyltransferase